MKTKTAEELYTPENAKKLGNKFLYIIGHGNLYNIAVLIIAFIASRSISPLNAAISLVLIVLGMKWFLTQLRSNVDTVAVYDEVSKK